MMAFFLAFQDDKEVNLKGYTNFKARVNRQTHSWSDGWPSEFLVEVLKQVFKFSPFGVLKHYVGCSVQTVL
jgi:hypothetical protein